MKKIFTLILIMATLASSAQSIRLFYNGQALNNQDTVNIDAVIGTTNDIYIEYANIADDDIRFIVSKEEVQMVPGATSTFCIGEQCYSGNCSREIFIQQDDMVTVMDSAMVFHATYTTPSNGISIIKYTFGNVENTADITSVILRYVTNVGIDMPTAKDITLRAYPNPATTGVNIIYDAQNISNAYLVIKNLTGMEIYRSVLSSESKMYVNISDFRSGIYLYGVEVNGTMLCTKKLLVK